MAPQSNLSDRLKAFADRFAALGRPSRPGGGYSGLAGGGLGSDGLGAPLVGGGSGHSEGGGGGGGYYSTGAAPPPSSRYDPPQTASAHHHHQHQQQSYGSVDVAGGGDAGAGAAVNLPTQVRGERWCFFFMGGERRESIHLLWCLSPLCSAIFRSILCRRSLLCLINLLPGKRKEECEEENVPQKREQMRLFSSDAMVLPQANPSKHLFLLLPLLSKSSLHACLFFAARVSTWLNACLVDKKRARKKVQA